MLSHFCVFKTQDCNDKQHSVWQKKKKEVHYRSDDASIYKSLKVLKLLQLNLMHSYGNNLGKNTNNIQWEHSR